ncbi:MAG: hypothetical protein NXI25_07795 [bacterium]|nr:hypothetical protein [bacterium]
MGKSNNNRNRLLYLLQEIAIVVIGVLIAVSINNYKEKSDNEAYIKKTLLAIEHEIHDNKSGLDSVLERHIRIYEYMELDSVKEGQTISEMLYDLGGFQVAFIRNISLRFFVANKAELLDFQLISQLSEIEQSTDMLAKKIDLLANFAYEHLSDSSEEAKLRFSIILMDVIDSERNLSEAYAHFLESNEAFLKPGEKER